MHEINGLIDESPAKPNVEEGGHKCHPKIEDHRRKNQRQGDDAFQQQRQTQECGGVEAVVEDGNHDGVDQGYISEDNLQDPNGVMSTNEKNRRPANVECVMPTAIPKMYGIEHHDFLTGVSYCVGIGSSILHLSPSFQTLLQQYASSIVSSPARMK